MIGQTISHYKITEKLGEGGMGVVYKAKDLALERSVALKFLAAHAIEDPEHKARFVREAKAAARLDHQNICPVYEIDEVDGQTFFALAYLEGQTLKDKIADALLCHTWAKDAVPRRCGRGFSRNFPLLAFVHSCPTASFSGRHFAPFDRARL